MITTGAYLGPGNGLAPDAKGHATVSHGLAVQTQGGGRAQWLAQGGSLHLVTELDGARCEGRVVDERNGELGQGLSRGLAHLGHGIGAERAHADGGGWVRTRGSAQGDSVAHALLDAGERATQSLGVFLAGAGHLAQQRLGLGVEGWLVGGPSKVGLTAGSRVGGALVLLL